MLATATSTTNRNPSPDERLRSAMTEPSTSTPIAFTTAAVTNMEVGLEIDMGHTGVSRLRSGDRLPSIRIMYNIQSAYAWPIADQIDARMNGNYGRAFENVLIDRYGSIHAPKER